MRADRLVAILLMLQRRGQVTAAEVAAELEISERTARRDLDALGAAGMPVYSTQGRGGGWRLAGGGRTDLSGLTEAEARALFLVAGPSAGATKEVRAALRKLVRALPEPMRASAEAASQAVVVDPTSWGRTATAAHGDPPLLDAVQRAVIDAVQIELSYVAKDGTPSTRAVHPLGLAAKATRWYLIASTDAGMRTFRVDRITAAVPTGEPVVRPEGFDLEQAWRLVVDSMEMLRAPITANCLAVPSVLGYLRFSFGQRLSIGGAHQDGRVAIEVRAFAIEALVATLGGFGDTVEVLAPPELRSALARCGETLVALYAVECA